MWHVEITMQVRTNINGCQGGELEALEIEDIREARFCNLALSRLEDEPVRYVH